MNIVYKLMFIGISETVNSTVTQAQKITTIEESPFDFKASYIGDVVSNFSGGIYCLCRN